MSRKFEKNLKQSDWASLSFEDTKIENPKACFYPRCVEGEGVQKLYGFYPGVCGGQSAGGPKQPIDVNHEKREKILKTK